MLKAKMPQYNCSSSSGVQTGVQLKIHSASSDEDPYSLSPSGSSGSSGPAVNRLGDSSGYYGPQSWAVEGGRKKSQGRGRSGRKGAQQTAAHTPEDPYYHGLSARVPVFGGKHDRQR